MPVSKAEFKKRMAAGKRKAAAARKAKTVKKAAPKKRKPAVKKRKAKAIKSPTPRKRTMGSRTQKARKYGSRTKKSIGSSLKTGMIGEVIKGIGAGSLATIVVSRVAPQYAPIAPVAAGFVTGGMIGGAANLLLSGGLQGMGGLFGGNSAPAQEFGV